MQLENIGDLIRMVYSHNPAEQLEGVSQFRKLLSIGPLPCLVSVAQLHSHAFADVVPAERHPPITEVIRCGIVPQLVQYLGRGDFPKLQVRDECCLDGCAALFAPDGDCVAGYCAADLYKLDEFT